MTRRHATLENMVEVAQNKGISDRGKWVVTMERESLHKMVDLGYKQEEQVKDVYTFIHWGTPILTITQEGSLLAGYKTSHKVLHGESKSDSDAINAMLQHFGIQGERYTYKPVNGGFQLV